MNNILIKKTGVYFIGNIASKALMAIVIPIYAFFVTPAAAGNYDYWLSLAQTAAPIVFLAIWEAILKHLISSETASCQDKIKDTVLAFLIIALSFSILSMPIALHYFGYDSKMLISVYVMCWALGIFQIWQYFARSLGSTRAFAESGVIASIVTFLLILVLVCTLRLQEFGLVASYVSGQAAGLVFLERRIRLIKSFRLRNASLHLLRKLLAYSIPCVFNLIAATLTLTIGRMLVMDWFGSEANGLYSFALKFANVITAVGSIFSMAVIEEGIIRAKTKGASEFYSHVSSALLVLLSALSCIALPAIALFYDLIAETEFAASFSLIPLSLLYALMSVMSTQFGSVFMAVGKTGSQATTTIAALIVATVVSYNLARPLGLNGIMAGLVIGTATMMVSRFLLAQQHLPFALHPKGLGVLTVLFFLLLMALCAHPFGNTILFHSGCLLIACMFALPFALRSIREISDVPEG